MQRSFKAKKTQDEQSPGAAASDPLRLLNAMGTHVEKVHFGILGTALIAVDQCKAIAACPLAVLHAVGSRSLDRAASFARENSVSLAYSSYEEVLADPLVQAVYIPLPTSLHHEWVMKAIASGKHVLCDKPLENVDLVREWVAACDKASLVFMDGTMWSHHRRTEVLRQRLFLEKFIGDVRSVSSTFNVVIPGPNNIRFDPHLEPFGALGDLGWYCIRASLFAMREDLPESVWGTAHRNPTSGAILSFSGHMTFSRGRFANFSCSFESNAFQQMEIFGTEGNVMVPNFVVPSNPRFNKGVTTYEIRMLAPDANLVTDYLSKTARVEEGTGLRNYLMIEKFCSLVLRRDENTKEERAYWAELAVKTQLILDALLRSASQGSIVVPTLSPAAPPAPASPT
jgi:predicted dehydrogenase